MTPPKCHLCGSESRFINDDSDSGFVSSDCQPTYQKAQFVYCSQCFVVQKNINTEWQKSVDKIYNDYKIYEQAKGKEQNAFNYGSGQGNARSKLIAEWTKEKTNMKQPTLLDIGCGNGAFLREFSRVNHESKLYGSELNEINRAIIEQINNCKFICSPISQINRKFDIISLIHVLEHIPNPQIFLQEIRDKLEEKGCLLIEVPNLKESPFDLFIFDHCTHFTEEGILRLLDKSGFKPIHLSTSIVAKEITIIAEPVHSRHDEIKNQTIEATVDPSEIARAQLNLAGKIKEKAMLEYDKPLYILGSSISATWLAKELNFQISGFIEEDIDRVGNEHCGVQIYSPTSIEEESMLLLPFSSETSTLLAERLSSEYPLLRPIVVRK